MIAAGGVRITWHDLPGHVRAAVEEKLGAPVVSTESQAGGFSPGTADRIVTATGDRAFVKAVSPAQNERSAQMARVELHVTAALPAAAPVPRLLDSFDDGHWVVLIFEDVAGRHPRTPWEPDEVDAAVRALGELARSLTPAPVPGAPSAAAHLDQNLDGWRRIAADPPPDLDPWLAAHLDRLIAAGDRARGGLTGDTLVHADIRADNMLIRPDGTILVVDWPWACVGPAWLDRALLAMNVLVHGGDGDRILAGLEAPDTAADAVAAFAGFFLDVARLPPVPGLPTVRAFQRFQADALLPWLRHHVGAAAHPREPGSSAD